MFELTKEFGFEASHVLPHQGGKCARLHGHSWRAFVTLRGHFLQTGGCSREMVVDFGDLKAVVQPLLDDYLDHHHLNDSLQMENPTSEAVAKWLFDSIEAVLPSRVRSWAQLECVRVDETCTSSCTYFRR